MAGGRIIGSLLYGCLGVNDSSLERRSKPETDIGGAFLLGSVCGVGTLFFGTGRVLAVLLLAVVAVVLIVVIFLILVVALREMRLAALALLNVPLGLIGGVAAVALATPVLSVSSLVGFVTVTGFVLRNGILLLQRYRDGLQDGHSVEEAIREGSQERMVPIVMTSLTTVLGLIPLMLAGDKPGGELLARRVM